ncbi:MAG: hypothetical protein Q4D38_00835 [Planctomycetia bacterium]|nr:hypothetical protein [Planctomycetia bacterium]
MRSRTLRGEFCATGRGEDAKWGVARTLNFQYSVYLIAESKILSKKTLPSGYIKIEEKRTFKNVSDSLCVSDVDFQLNLETLPVDKFSCAIDILATAYAGISGDLVTAGTIVAEKNYWTRSLKAVDGISLRALLGLGGIEVPQSVEEYLNKFGESDVERALGGVRSISGKSYIITWYQKEAGLPMGVTFTNEDGSAVVEEEELLVLRRVNTFIDSHIVPNMDCESGDSWKVSVGNIQEVLDPYVEGIYTGELEFKRTSDDQNGAWNIELQPGRLQVQNDENAVTGRLTMKKGYAKVSPKNLALEELFVEGTAKLEKLTPHHWLFTARILGDCAFQGRILSAEMEESSSEIKE